VDSRNPSTNSTGEFSGKRLQGIKEEAERAVEIIRL